VRGRDLLASPPLTGPAAQRLIAYADGDARRLLNAYENLVNMAGGLEEIDEAQLEKSLGEQLRRYDKGGRAVLRHDLGAAQGGARLRPDASLYWFVRMLDGGVDPRYAARRMVRMAAKDIGLADPRALRITLDAAEVYERLGSPRASSRWPSSGVSRDGATSRTRCTPVQGAGRSSRRTHPRGAAAIAQCTDTVDEGAGLRTRYRYAHDEEDGFAAGERFGPTAWKRRPSTSRCREGSRSASAKSWPELRRINAERIKES